MVNHRNLTSAMIDSRDFLAAKKRADNEVLLPAGPKIAFTGGLDFNDHRLIWAKLDQVHAKHPDMVLLHGKSPKGAEKIAAKWADARKVPRSEEHTSELQSLMRISYAVFCLKKKNKHPIPQH